ncbi:transcriptional repressor NrdR [bacterium]|nr:transcriptional repressor NrdR [bacterium]
MRCPHCGSAETVVRDSRAAENDTVVRRRRGCDTCGGRFTTFERVQLRELMVLKRGGRRVLFDREKLRRSVKLALQKRPVTDEQLDQMISGIVRKLENKGEAEFPSSVIGQLVMDSLGSLDPVAYVRYASVYRDFRTPADFARFIETQPETRSRVEAAEPEEEK